MTALSRRHTPPVARPGTRTPRLPRPGQARRNSSPPSRPADARSQRTPPSCGTSSSSSTSTGQRAPQRAPAPGHGPGGPGDDPPHQGQGPPDSGPPPVPAHLPPSPVVERAPPRDARRLPHRQLAPVRPQPHPPAAPHLDVDGTARLLGEPQQALRAGVSPLRQGAPAPGVDHGPAHGTVDRGDQGAVHPPDVVRHRPTPPPPHAAPTQDPCGHTTPRPLSRIRQTVPSQS